MKLFWRQLIAIIISAMIMLSPVLSKRSQNDDYYPRIVYVTADPTSISVPSEIQKDSRTEKDVWPTYYDATYDVSSRSDNRHNEEDLSRSQSLLSLLASHERSSFALSDQSIQKSLRFNSKEVQPPLYSSPASQNKDLKQDLHSSTIPYSSYRSTNPSLTTEKPIHVDSRKTNLGVERSISEVEQQRRLNSQVEYLRTNSRGKTRSINSAATSGRSNSGAVSGRSNSGAVSGRSPSGAASGRSNSGAELRRPSSTAETGSRSDPSSFFIDREERKKLSYSARNKGRNYDDNQLQIVTTESAVKEDPKVTTDDGMTIFSTSSTSIDDRMHLRSRNRNSPRLVFLADDPEAALRIPTLISTMYDSSPSSPAFMQHGFRSENSGRSGVITSSSINDDLKFYTTAEDSPTTYISNGIEREIDIPDKTYRSADASDYFPSRHPPSLGSYPLSYNEHHTPSGDGFSRSRPMKNMTRVKHIEAECQDDFMRIHVRFNGSFEGLVYSSEYSHDLDCVYINGSGKETYEFFIKLNRCGTLGTNDQGDNRRTMQKNVMWNTLTVQYNPLIEEEWDEHFKVTCEYGLEIWNTVTFPFLDVEVQTGNPMTFTLSPPECHMDIRYGFGPDGSRVTSPVRVGDPLTLVIYMRSQYDGFDIVVSDCFAHNGGTKKIMLIDSYGCPVDDKLISHFDGQSLKDGVFETQVFAFMKTFRFTGSPALYIECGVRMCHGDCPSQLCHWRRSRREKKRRSVRETTTTVSPPANVSDSLNLFQSLQVIRDDDNTRSRSRHEEQEDDFCFKANHFTFIVGTAGSLLGIFAVASLILCLRLRRLRKEPDGPHVPQAPIQRTYRSEFVPSSKRRLE